MSREQWTSKVCKTCGNSKAADEFYTSVNGIGGMNPSCKKCENSRHRPASDTKLLRLRARSRAVAILIRWHRADYDNLFEQQLALAIAEANDETPTQTWDGPEATIPAHARRAATEATNARPRIGPTPLPRFKPGPRMPGETAGDRLDVARCPHCIKSHDSGHACSKCGNIPAGAAPPGLRARRGPVTPHIGSTVTPQ